MNTIIPPPFQGNRQDEQVLYFVVPRAWMDLCLSLLHGLGDWSSTRARPRRKEIAANIGCNYSSGLAEPEVRFFFCSISEQAKDLFIVFILYHSRI